MLAEQFGEPIARDAGLFESSESTATLPGSAASWQNGASRAERRTDGAPRSIPVRYRDGITKQIAIRLPDDLVEFVDELVKDGEAKSRATVVTRALQRERRRTIAARDAAILARSGTDADMDMDMDRLAHHVARAPLDLE